MKDEQNKIKISADFLLGVQQQQKQPNEILNRELATPFGIGTSE